MNLPRKKQLIAVAIGILLGGLPLIGFNYWLGTLIERQGMDDIEISAKRAAAILEGRLNQAAGGLDELSRRGVDSCAPVHLAALNEVAFATSPVKELSVLNEQGQIECSTLGVPPGDRIIFKSHAVAGLEGVSVDVVWVDGRPPAFLQVRRTLANGNALAALVPVELLLPLTASHGGPFGAWARLRTTDGTFIAEGGNALPPDAREQGILAAEAQSSRFGISVLVETPRQRSDERFDDLSIVRSVVNGLVAIGALLLALLLLRRSAGHPLADIERALAANEFIAYYQPIVDITSAKLIGAEVLVRWRKADGTVISPAAFIPMLEQGGLIVDMTRKLMRRVCAEVGPAYAVRPKTTISFNLTATHFADDDVVADVRSIFEGSSIRLSQVVLELTERQPLRSLTATRRVIAALQGLGCSVALDDVGTGHSGLSSMLKLGVDIIKIDKMFVDTISSERNSATIIETLVDLANSMRMHVVAEGVENFEQVAQLRARGIRAAQGYVFAPPLPASSFLTLLEAIDPLSAGEAADQIFLPVSSRQ